MDTDLLVSVIVPIFNTRKYIEEALFSILGQSYKHLEIILVDDGSTDGCGPVCDDFEKRDARIKVIHQKNQGVSAARNAGLDIATGEIIAFLDPDDVMHPEMIRRMLLQMIQDNSDIVVCNFSFHDTEDRLNNKCFSIGESKSITVSQAEAAKMIAEQKVETAVWNKIYKRYVWEDLRFPEGRIFEGTYVIYDIFDQANLVSVMGEELIMHRKRAGSICNTYSLQHILDGNYATDYRAQCVKKHDYLPENCYKKMIRIPYHILIQSYLKYGYSNPEDKEGLQEIRNALSDLEKRESLKPCAPFDKLIYYGIKLSPQMMKKVFGVYKRIKR